MDKLKVLFVCNHNSARSQMAEELLRREAGDSFQVESAGFQPGEINPLVIDAMAEVGIDLSRKKTQSVFQLFKEGRLYDYVITVCDDSLEKKCPVFPGVTHRWHWPFPDPSALEGTYEEKMAKVREIRDAIHERITNPFDTPFRTQNTYQSGE